MKSIINQVVLGFFMAALGACGPLAPQRASLAHSDLSADMNASFQPLRVNSIAVYPMEIGVGASGSDAESINQKLTAAFDRGTSLEILNRKDPNGVARALSGVRGESGSLIARAAHFGDLSSAQGVLTGRVTKFERSDGSGYGASNTASVAFQLWLIDPKTRAILWSAHYDTREQPLTDNLFRAPESIEHGLRFEDRDALLARGFDEAAKELERLRRPSL